MLYFPGMMWLFACVLMLLSRLKNQTKVGMLLKISTALGLVPLFLGPCVV